MNSTERSILQQKAKQTYNRNQLIKQAYKIEQNMAQLGRLFHLSRQAIKVIIMRNHNHDA